MRAERLKLLDFRNFSELDANLADGINIICGDNAQGKTNFLEAVYFCATGRSHRASRDAELVRFGCQEAHLRITVNGGQNIDAHINRTLGKKYFAVDHSPIKKLNELFGTLLVVFFSPEDLKLIKSGPSERRTFMDMEMCQLSAAYCHELQQYHHALKQRNILLKAIPKDRTLTETIFIWDEHLCALGRQIMKYRAEFACEIDAAARVLHARMTGGAETLAVKYLPNVQDAAHYADKLRRSLERDIQSGSTAVGVHKDDLLFTVNGNEARIYGSQGQQRTAALAAKLAEAELIRLHKKASPVILLDDVLSELDLRRQSFLLEHLAGSQTVVTCTGIEDISKIFNGQASVSEMNFSRINVMEMKAGKIFAA
ncbi:MAG: DNA replication/repair protein RecF [Defluviitaleaceae bacterium]|nr:DNA replication/repair protein RecF [Defluviitaleaceae bacterium]